MAPPRLTLVLATVLACAAAPAASAGAKPPGVTGQPVAQDPGEIRDYWSPSRMRAAQPVPLPRSAGAEGDGEARASAFPPDLETDPAFDTSWPQRLHGKLFVTLGGSDASCSATVTKSFRRDLVVTAGHCLYFGGGPSGWATNVAFVPAYRNGARPYGTFPAVTLRVPKPWRRNGSIAFDLGMVNLAPTPVGRIQDLLGAVGITFNRPDKAYRKKRFQLFGYPGVPQAYYDAERLIRCNSRFRGFEVFSDAPVVSPCHQQFGSSGGGWIRKRKLTSVISHGACALPSDACQAVAGTYFGDAAYRLWDAAAGKVPKGRRKKLKRCKRVSKPAKFLRCRSKAQTYKPVVR